MALFKKDNQPPAEPPKPPETPPAPQFVTVETFNAMQQQLGAMAENLKSLTERQKGYQQQAPAAPAAPPEDPHKATKARIAEVDRELADTNMAIEKSYANYGEGIGPLLTKQQKLMFERSDLQGKLNTPTGTDPRLDAGFRTLDTLAQEVMSGKMPYLSVKEVKEFYDNHINSLPPEQRMNPEVKQGVYNLAVGANLSIIEELRKQEWLREQENPTQDQQQGAASGRQQPSNGSGEVKPEDLFSPETLRMIKNSRHRTVDRYCESLGYADFTDYAEKNKDYLGIEREEE